MFKDRLSNKIIDLSKNVKGMKKIKDHTDNLDIAVKLSKYLKDNKEKINKAVIKEIAPVFHLSDLVLKD